DLVTKSWNSFALDDSNGMIRFKKLQMLKKEIRTWTLDYKRQQVGHSKDLNSKLIDIDKMLDQGGVTDDILLSRMEVLKQIHDVQSLNNRDIMQKAKIRWAIKGDENSKYFHTIINKKRVNLSVKGVMVDGDWIDDPDLVKQEFRSHFMDRFQDPGSRRGSLNFLFPIRLSNDQILDLESLISKDEIRKAVWGYGVDKSPGPDGFTFEFFRKYWAVVGPDFSTIVEWFFKHGDFAIGCNSSFVALITKVLDPKVVSDYRPISLIGSLYKVVTKILATRLSLVISDLISDVQTAFFHNRQILDCFRVDHSITLSYLFYADDEVFIGFRVDHSITLSYLFYADDEVFIGMSINIQKSHLLGVSIPYNYVAEAAKSIGCSIIKALFKYLGILVGDNMSSIKAWDETISKMKKRLSRVCYAGNPNNNNGWIEADVPLLGELRAKVDEPMIDPTIDEVDEPIAKGEEQVIALVIDVDEDIAMLFGDDDTELYPPPSTYEIGGPSTAAAEGQSFTLLAPRFLVPQLVIEDLSTGMGNLEYEHGQLVKKIMASQMVQAVGRLEQVGTQMEQGQQAATQRDEVMFGLSQQGEKIRDSNRMATSVPILEEQSKWLTPKSKNQVDYASRGAETLELELRSTSNEQRAPDAQLFS
nr:RNA-directed DNA polymerase, eukaryota [Tanacetum cinerariifolium]